MTTTPTSGGTGGCYWYAPGSNGRFAIVTSSNSNNGVNQLAMALNTSGQSNILLTYDLINVIGNNRGVGTVCQYRVGSSGGWTSLLGSGNPYNQAGAVPAGVSASLSLPAAAENQPLVQIRWAVWREPGSGSSSAFAIDNISVTAAGSGPVVSSVVLSGGPTYALNEISLATVSLSQPPEVSATINVSSGAFATAAVTIQAPDTSGAVEVSMANAGNFVATATAVSGCGGTANTPSFTVVGDPAAAFAATGVNTINDSAGNGNGYIDPGENDVALYFQIVNSGTADATGVSATLTSQTSAATISNAVQAYPAMPVGMNSANANPFLLSLSPAHVCGGTINLQLAVTSNEGNGTLLLALPTCPPVTDLYGPPADYYLTATGTGAALKSQLHNIISKDYWNGFLNSSTHNVRSYDAAKNGLQVADIDVNNTAHLILIYTGISIPKTWDGGATWNREHSWPDSRGINGALPAYSDMHHLRPCNPSLNSSRGNKPFGTGTGYWDADQGAPHRGRAARTMFYMSTRYDGTAPNPALNLTLVDGMPSGSQMGDLAKLLDWHYSHPVDLDERRRNEAVFSSTMNPSYYQGNRNPYIDHPEFVWSIWGTGPNDSQLYLGTQVPSDGASTALLDLGAVIVNALLPAPRTVVLNKNGAAPTTYDILAAGAAVSPAAGTRQAFLAGAQSRNIIAGLSGSTALAGPKSGTIAIDNTDLTSAAPGKGSADGNDLINIALAVLDHANASFNASEDQNALTIDFGSVSLGSGIVSLPCALQNLVQTPGYTAALDLDAIVDAGDSAILTTSLAPFTMLPAGSQQAFSVFLDTAASGSFSATYTLFFTDENLAGAAPNADLVLTLTAQVVACVSGDANCDQMISAADAGAFVDALLGLSAPCSPCATDLNADARVDSADIQPFVVRLMTP